MTRDLRFALLPAVLFVAPWASFAEEEVILCGFAPSPPTALVDARRSAFDRDIEVRIAGSGDEVFCHASLDLRLSELPGRSQVPRPRELAPELMPAAKQAGAKLCTVTVFVTDDIGEIDSEEPDPDLCWHGTYRYDSDFWRVETDDARCW